MGRCDARFRNTSSLNWFSSYKKIISSSQLNPHIPNHAGCPAAPSEEKPSVDVHVFRLRTSTHGQVPISVASAIPCSPCFTALASGSISCGRLSGEKSDEITETDHSRDYHTETQSPEQPVDNRQRECPPPFHEPTRGVRDAREIEVRDEHRGWLRSSLVEALKDPPQPSENLRLAGRDTVASRRSPAVHVEGRGKPRGLKRKHPTKCKSKRPGGHAALRIVKHG
jgi:hypothetical protein